MDSRRARRIARSFSRIDGIDVNVVSGGILVRQGGKSSYFVREACFWPYVFRAAGAAGAEVSDIEEGLAA